MKPLFQPLSMTQITTIPLTDFTHVSTFSGAGGTCLGFRMAGFRTVWANDIEDHARQCYRLNLNDVIDGRDIRHVTADDILTAIGLKTEQLDVFEGSPPCTMFSTAGQRAKAWNQTRLHAGHIQKNIEDLFFEWLRILEGLRPRVFVAENVAGLVKGVSKGYFKQILRRMITLGYRTEARLIDAQWLGVPQQRCRVIFIGVRDDLKRVPRFPTALMHRYSVCDALPWADYVHHKEGGFSEIDVTHRPSRTITTQSELIIFKKLKARSATIDELKRICSFPDDFRVLGSYGQQWTRLANAVPPLMAKAIAESVRDVLLDVQH